MNAIKLIRYLAKFIDSTLLETTQQCLVGFNVLTIYHKTKLAVFINCHNLKNAQYVFHKRAMPLTLFAAQINDINVN